MRLAPPGAVARGAPGGGCSRTLHGASAVAVADYTDPDDVAGIIAYYDAALRARGWAPAPDKANTGSIERYAFAWERGGTVFRLGIIKLACYAGREAEQGRVAAVRVRAQATASVPVTSCQVWKRSARVSR